MTTAIDRVKADIKRTPETNKKYLKFLASGERAHFVLVKEWRYWELVENAYPYDAIAERHHLLFPLRPFPTEEFMSLQEFIELREIKDELSGSYDSFMENFESARSILEHFHYHLINWKQND